MRLVGSITRRSLIVGLAASGVGVGVSGTSRASLVMPVSLARLVGRSQHVLVGTPRSASSEWEATDTGQRIVTYTELEVDQPLDGRPPSRKRLLVRSLGGVVDDLGQTVHGEAQLVLGEQAVVFLSPAQFQAARADGATVFAVTAMAQGHYALRTASEAEVKDMDGPTNALRLFPNSKALELFREQSDAAVHQLRGRTVAACEKLVAGELL